jgi:hypothetical protein
MDPTTYGCIVLIQATQAHVKDLLDAVRGAHNKNTQWYESCHELGESCSTISLLLQDLVKAQQELSEDSGQASRLTGHSSVGLEITLDSLNSALVEGTQLVNKCRNASKVMLFLRGNAFREHFHKVTEKIARSLRNLPLATLAAGLSVERHLGQVCQQLEKRRYESL